MFILEKISCHLQAQNSELEMALIKLDFLTLQDLYDIPMHAGFSISFTNVCTQTIAEQKLFLLLWQKLK